MVTRLWVGNAVPFTDNILCPESWAVNERMNEWILFVCLLPSDQHVHARALARTSQCEWESGHQQSYGQIVVVDRSAIN